MNQHRTDDLRILLTAVDIAVETLRALANSPTIVGQLPGLAGTVETQAAALEAAATKARASAHHPLHQTVLPEESASAPPVTRAESEGNYIPPSIRRAPPWSRPLFVPTELNQGNTSRDAVSQWLIETHVEGLLMMADSMDMDVTIERVPLPPPLGMGRHVPRVSVYLSHAGRAKREALEAAKGGQA